MLDFWGVMLSSNQNPGRKWGTVQAEFDRIVRAVAHQNPGYLLYIRDEILPSYIGIIS